MPITPRNNDPLKDYVTPGLSPSISSDGLVYNKIYAHTGVVDTLPASNNTSPYNDPTTTLINNNNYIQFNPAAQTEWISSQDFGGPDSAPVTLSMYVVNDTYFNSIYFNILNVPCYVELITSSGTPLTDSSSFIIDGGSDINTTTDWVRIKYQTTSGTTNGSPNPVTLKINAGDFIQIRITRQKTVKQQGTITKTLIDLPYSVGVKNFSIKLNIQYGSDVPPTPFSVQNKFGFVETYKEKFYSASRALDNSSSTYWKSEPQPVGDAIVNYYLQVADGSTITSLNRLYIDPVYDGCKFNLYYTKDSGPDASQFTWSPVQRDFTLRNGLYEIPTIQCTHIKLEFVQLAPEIYDLPFDSVIRTINTFPYDIEEYFSNIESTIIDGKAKSYSFFGSNNNQQPIYTSTYSTMFGAANDINSSSWPLVGPSGNNVQTPSALTQIVDPTISYKLIDQNGSYNNNSYTQFLQRRFPYTGKHDYSQITIDHSWHQAYFVGLYSISAFYETTSYDNIQPTLSSLTSRSNNNTFVGQDNNNYIILNPDDTATTPWMNTMDTFTGFSIAGLTTDWQSFLTDDQVLMNDTSNLTGGRIHFPLQTISNLGTSKIVSVVPTATGYCYVQTGSYPISTNIANYLDANFLNGTSSWTALDSTTISNTTVTWASGVASGISVSGGQYSAAYNFSLPGVYNPNGIVAWNDQFGSNPYGAVGFGSYAVLSGSVQNNNPYYFLTNIQVPNTGGVPSVNANLTMYTQFINPSNGLPIAGTTVTGSNISIVAGSGSSIVTATGGMWLSTLPSNTVQMVISGSGSSFNLFEMSINPTPVTSWVGPSDRKNMRVSAVARVFLPSSSNGIYRVSLMGTDYVGNVYEIAYKQFKNNSLPISTWINIEVPGYSGNNYKSFYAQISQLDNTVMETFYLSMLSPFYHPVRYEYITQSGSTKWQPVIAGLNNSNSVVNVANPGTAASGIQVRMTSLDLGVVVNALSIVPRYIGNPYYSSTNIDYIGDSKTNELSIRQPINRKKLFLLNKEVYPVRFSIEQVANTTVPYVNM